MTATARSEQPLTLRVREVMSRTAHHARLNDTVSQVARYMSELRVGELVVVDLRNRVHSTISQQRILGFYLSYVDASDPDLAAAVIAANHEPVESLLSNKEPVTVRHDAPLVEAISLLTTHGLDCVPVVDRYDELKGMLTLADLLLHFTQNETAGLETGFEFFEPVANQTRTRPAFIRRANKELVVPLDRIAEEHEFSERVMLGFDDASGRILIKFIPAGMKSATWITARRQGENMVIDAAAFVVSYGLLDRSTTFEVSVPEDTRYLVLTPR